MRITGEILWMKVRSRNVKQFERYDYNTKHTKASIDTVWELKGYHRNILKWNTHP